MKIIKVIQLFICIFICFSATVFAQDVCLSLDSAMDITVELEKCKFKSQMLDVEKQTTEELRKQVDLYKQLIDLKDKEIKVERLAKESYKEHGEFIQKSYAKALEDQKPSFIRQFINFVGFIGLGVLIGIVL